MGPPTPTARSTPPSCACRPRRVIPRLGDYGPTIILEHRLDSIPFFTLYGHLSRPSLEGLEPGLAFAAGTASYGQLIEGIPTADMSPDDDPWDFRQQQYLMAVKHTADNRYRVNIGLVNPTTIAASYHIQAYGADGNCPPAGCASIEVTVPPLSMVQRTDPFAGWQGGEWSAVIIQVKCKTDGAGGFAYASVVDNATNDAFFVRGVKKMAPTG
jgi:hypothetical protein